MDYREVSDRYFNNLGFVKEDYSKRDSIRFKQAKQDFADALIDIYGHSAPTKTFRKQMIETDTIHEDFVDAVYVDNLTLSNFAAGASRVETTSASATVIITGLQDIKGIQVSFGGTPTAPPVTDFADGNVKILNELGEELYSEDFVFTDVNGAEEVLAISGITYSSVNMSIVVTLNRSADYTNVWLSDLIITQAENKILLPDDFFMPLEIIFDETSDRVTLVGNEMHRERFDRWIPGRYSDPSTEVTTEGSIIRRYYATSENIEFDRTLGYTLDIQPEGTYLLFKPAFTGVISVVYTYLPTPQTNDGDFVQIHRAFVDVLVYNATIRGLRKLLVESGIEQFRFLALSAALKEYKSEYPLKLNRFTNFMKGKAEPQMIKPMDFLNDPDMLLH